MSKKTPEILIIDDDDDDEYENDPEIAVLTKDIPVASASPPISKKKKGNNNSNKSDHHQNGTRIENYCIGKVKNGYNSREFQDPNVPCNNNEVIGCAENGVCVGVGATIAVASNNANGRTSRNSNGNSNDKCDDEDDDDEQQPITQLPQPNYERQFRSSILKPLHSILDCNTQDETLSMVRMQIFIVMQGLYLEAKRVYSVSNTHSTKTSVATGSSKKKNGEAHNYNGSDSATPCLFEHGDDDVLTAPGLFIPGEDNVYEFSMDECSFADPDAEAISKKKLLPQVIKMLLKLGDGGGDRKTTFGESYLSVVAEDLVASILLDFIGMVSKILSLVNLIIDDNGAAAADNDGSDENHNVKERVKAGEDDCNPSSKKKKKNRKYARKLLRQ